MRRGWSADEWLGAEHVAPTPTHPGARGVIDEHLESRGLARNITARCAHFSLIPAMVASSLLILTTRRGLMGGLANRRLTNALAGACTAIILVLNLLLLYITFGGTLPGAA